MHCSLHLLPLNGVGLAVAEDEELSVAEKLLSVIHGGRLDKPGIGIYATTCGKTTVMMVNNFVR